MPPGTRVARGCKDQLLRPRVGRSSTPRHDYGSTYDGWRWQLHELPGFAVLLECRPFRAGLHADRFSPFNHSRGKNVRYQEINFAGGVSRTSETASSRRLDAIVMPSSRLISPGLAKGDCLHGRLHRSVHLLPRALKRRSPDLRPCA
jgi:hypothetical protein